MINTASASPETHFWVNPPAIGETPSGKFEIQMHVAEAPNTFAWEIILNWDPNCLELISVTQGDFLHRWEYDPFDPTVKYPKYPTSFGVESLSGANLQGKIRVGCTLIGNWPEEDWATGDGWLCSFGFLAQKRGDTIIDLSDTRLWDHRVGGYPAYTYYDNFDGIVTVTSFYYAGLFGSKLKANGKAGVSEEGGLRTTVGAENLLEAQVKNTGTFDVYVKVSIEIRDAAGYMVVNINCGTVLLPVGEAHTFSVTWIAGEPDIYRITAYSFYGEVTPTIPGGFSRTLRLKAV